MGHCCECGTPCGLLELWCDEHRRRGPRGAWTAETWEEYEASHARKVERYAARGQV